MSVFYVVEIDGESWTLTPIKTAEVQEGWRVSWPNPAVEAALAGDERANPDWEREFKSGSVVIADPPQFLPDGTVKFTDGNFTYAPETPTLIFWRRLLHAE